MNEKECDINLAVANEALSSLNRTISVSDEKAAALLTALGIVFGLSSFSLESLRGKSENTAQFVFICIFGILYLSAFLLSVILLVFTIFPRKRPNSLKDFRPYAYYAEDVHSAFKQNKANILMKEEPGKLEIMNQLQICSHICHRKEAFLRVSSLSLVVFALSLVALVVLAFI